jgi:hypothetical protein
VTDLITGPVGYASAPVSSDQVPSSAFEGQDWFSTTKWAVSALARGYEMSQEMGVAPADSVSFSPPAPQPQQPLLTPEEANAQYGIKSQNGEMPDLTFDKPISDSAAASMSADWHEKMLRQDALARAPGGIVNGLGRWGVGMAAFMLDPINLAASFMPVVSEARVGAALAGTGLGGLEASFAGRTVVRMATGLVSGSANMVPLAGLRYGLSQLEGHDYGAADAMADIISGGVGGAALHTLIGGAGDLFGRGFRATPEAGVIDTDPVAREAALRTAVAQVADGRSVNIGTIVDIAAAEKAEADLRRFGTQHGIIDADAQAAQDAAAVTPAPDRTGAIEAAQSRLTGLHAEVHGYQADLDALGQRLAERSMDPETADRLAAIDQELTGAVPAARRAQLGQERTMLLEGRPLDTDLEAARTQAQQQGVSAAQARAQEQLTEAERQMDALLSKTTEEQRAEVQQRAASDRTLRIAATLQASRRQVASALAERTIRRFAGAIGADLGPGEAEGFARDIAASTPAELQQTIDHALVTIGQRSGSFVRPVDTLAVLRGEGIRPLVATGLRQLRVERDGALAELAGSPEFAAARGAPPAGDLATSQTASRAVTEAATELKTERPELAPDISERLAEQEARFKQLRGEGETEGTDGTRGMLTPIERAQMNQLDEEFSQQKKDAGLWQDAAACFLGGT